MIHEVLQFALRIAFRCVLHRDGSLDIHCTRLYVVRAEAPEFPPLQRAPCGE